MAIHVDYTLEITQLPRECVEDCGKPPGAKDEAVDYWLDKLEFTVDRDRAIRCLQGYGAWDQEQLDSRTDRELAAIILFLACCDFWEFTVEAAEVGLDPWAESAPGATEPRFEPAGGSDIFVLE